LFQALEHGYTHGKVNYENRKRDIQIETDKFLALELLSGIRRGLGKADKHLILELSYDEDSEQLIEVQTNYNREIAYNLEHTIHHMALIRIGINEISAIQLPENYGVASSTVKYRQTCVQ